jgi:hypothetical protein
MTTEAERYDSLIKTYKTKYKTIDRINDIFTQGDIRYTSTEYEVIVAGFVENKAISIRKKTLKKTPVKTAGIRGPQKEMKAFGIRLLKDLGYRIVSIERGFMGGIPDVLAKKGEEIVAVECGPCAIRKAVDYLQRPKTSLWIIQPEGENYRFFTVTKSIAWDSFFEFHMSFQLGMLHYFVEKAFKI